MSSPTITIGTCTMGNSKGQPFVSPFADFRRHALAVGATGSGKTVTLKRLVECFITNHIPVVAVDVLGDLSGLAVPARRDTLAKIGMQPSTNSLSEADLRAVTEIGTAYEKSVHARVLSPCSDLAERMALSPLAPRPDNFTEMWDNDKDYLVLQADTAAANFMQRLGLGAKSSRLGGGPDVVRGIITDALMAAWETNIDLTGLEGLQNFRAHLERWGAPPLPDEAMNKVHQGVQGLSVGVEALWHKGVILDFNQLLTAPPGKTPLIVINIAHLPRDQHPWVVSQIIIALSHWAASKPALRQDDPPRVGLLIDELAGESGGNAILPPGNFKSLSGEGIRKILRQGRHWGLSLLAGTQSPRDVDSKSFINFTNRFVGRLTTAKDIDIALEGAPLADSKYSFLAKLIGNAQQGNMFALMASGGFEAIKVHWLSTVHSKFTPEQYRTLYKLGIIQKPDRPETTVLKDLPRSLMRFVADFKDRLDPKDLETLRTIADKYR